MTKPTFVMATICLNFSYGQIKEKSPAQNQLQLYQYGFCGFKSGYKPGFKIRKEIASRGKTINVRNYTIEQLFAIAYGAGAPISKEHIITEVSLKSYKRSGVTSCLYHSSKWLVFTTLCSKT